MNTMQTLNTVITMSSREIAELTGKQHKNVLRDIDNLLETLSSELSSGYKSSTEFNYYCEISAYVDVNGKSNRQYEMDTNFVLCLMSGYDAVARMKIISCFSESKNFELQSLSDFICKRNEIVTEKPEESFVKKPFMRHHRVNQYALYVVLFDHGVIKVGKGENALKRVNEHAKQASIFDRHVVDFFIEESPRITEEDLIKFCLQHGTLCNGNEYFKDLKYDQVVNFVKQTVKRKVLKLVCQCNV